MKKRTNGPRRVTVPRGFNLHHHFRRDARLAEQIEHVARQFCFAIGMPKTKPPIFTLGDALNYETEIQAVIRAGGHREDFEAGMTIQITRDTRPETIIAAATSEHLHIYGAKTYPGDVAQAEDITTNSGAGILDYRGSQFMECMFACAEMDIPWLSHCEVPDSRVREGRREQEFMPIFHEVCMAVPTLDAVIEHISSWEAAKILRFMQGIRPGKVAATVTVHHLFLTEEDLHDPHNCCAPRAKKPEDRQAIRELALSGAAYVGYGGDDAPHYRRAKEGPKPANGCANGLVALPLLVHFFDHNNALLKLDGFLMDMGMDFYGLERPEGRITLVEEPWVVPEEFNGVVPWMTGKQIPWRIVD